MPSGYIGLLSGSLLSINQRDSLTWQEKLTRWFDKLISTLLLIQELYSLSLVDGSRYSIDNEQADGSNDELVSKSFHDKGNGQLCLSLDTLKITSLKCIGFSAVV